MLYWGKVSGEVAVKRSASPNRHKYEEKLTDAHDVSSPSPNLSFLDDKCCFGLYKLWCSVTLKHEALQTRDFLIGCGKRLYLIRGESLRHACHGLHYGPKFEFERDPQKTAPEIVSGF